jgi:hypothetical protein
MNGMYSLLVHDKTVLPRSARAQDMSSIDNNATLWSNVQALMLHHWGEVNLNQLARSCKIGPATAARIKEQKTSVGLNVLGRIADHFGLDAWQLLVPGLDPKHPHALQPVSPAERALYAKILSAAQHIASDLEAGKYR